MTPTPRGLGWPLGIALVLTVAPLSGQRGPATAFTDLPAETLALACAPTVAFAEPSVAMRVTGAQDSFVRGVFATGDLVTIDKGAKDGVQVGQEFFVRRVLKSRRGLVSRSSPVTLRTVGWVRVYAVDEAMALVTVTYGCDSVELGDHLEPFALPVVPMPSATRSKPERDNYGHVMTGVDRRATFGKDDFFIIDRGSQHGVTPGMQFVLYRDKKARDNFLYDLGEAVAVDVKAETATLQVTVSRDAIHEGDYVAMRKE